MTLCTYGSAPDPSSPDYVWITWVDAHSWLGLTWGPFAWLAALVAPLLVKLSTFCATEPTQPVYPGDATVAAAATDPVAFETILQYLKDSATWWVWSHNCECNAGPVLTCGSTYAIGHAWSNTNFLGASTELGVSFTPQLAATLSSVRIWVQTNVSYPIGITLWDTGTGAAIYGFTAAWPGLGGHDIALPVAQALTAGHTYTISYAAPSSWTVYYETGAAPPNDAIIHYVGHSFHQPQGIFPGTASGGWEGINPIICAPGSPTTPADPPVPVTTIPDLPALACSTTGDLCSILQPTVSSTALLQQRLDVLQRRLLPFAWVAGTPSTPLTGAGFITVQDAVGCIVDVTTVPASWGASTDSPRRLYPAAGIVQGTSSSNVDEGRWIHYEHQVVLWNDSWSTSITYNFKPGIVATVTPIYPEP